MKIKANKDALNKVLTFLQTGIPGKQLIPVEGWIKFSIEGQKCTVSISNGIVEMTAFLKVESEGDCEFCVPAHTITQMVSRFPDGDININAIEKEGLGVITLKMKATGQRKNYQLGCVPAKEFPRMKYNLDNPKVKFRTDMKDLHDKIKIVGPNIPVSDVRTSFRNLTLFSTPNKKLSFLTGHGHIICRIDTDIDFTESLIVDHHITRFLSTLTTIGECEITITDNNFYLEYSGMTLCCRMVDAKVPNYQDLFDNEPDEMIEIDREDLIQSLIRLSTFDNEHSKINMQVKKQYMRLYAENAENNGEEVLDLVNDHDLEIDVNMKHTLFRSALTALKSDSVKIGFGKTGISVFVKPSKEDKDNQLWMFAPLAK